MSSSKLRGSSRIFTAKKFSSRDVNSKSPRKVYEDVKESRESRKRVADSPEDEEWRPNMLVEQMWRLEESAPDLRPFGRTG
jgi:hypothetical protein